MPQFMQRAAWSRVSFSLRGRTNSRKFLMRSGTGAYLRSCRSISRKPVILPIKPDALSLRHPEVRALARLEGWATNIPCHPSRLAEDGSHLRMTHFFLRPDRDFRLGV